jgi:hypothetical protein
LSSTAWLPSTAWLLIPAFTHKLLLPSPIRFSSLWPDLRPGLLQICLWDVVHFSER